MSIINEALKSVDKRKKTMPIGHLQQKKPTAPLIKWLSILLGFILLVIVILGAMIGVQKFTEKKTSDIQALQHHHLKSLAPIKTQQHITQLKSPTKQHKTTPASTTTAITHKTTPKNIPSKKPAVLHPADNTKSVQSQHSTPTKQHKIFSIKHSIPASPYTDIQKAAIKFLHAGNPKAAIALLKQESPDFNQYPDYYAQLAYLYLTAGQCQSAIPLYQQLTSLEATNENWWLGLASANMQCQNSNAALAAYQNTLKYAPTNAPYRDYIEQQIQNINE